MSKTVFFLLAVVAAGVGVGIAEIQIRYGDQIADYAMTLASR
ncbi:hypothetical protein [Mesorhizobium xinjiangense]|nr:hypothetical protein [Mesorhizobium xinjiangense]